MRSKTCTIRQSDVTTQVTSDCLSWSVVSPQAGASHQFYYSEEMSLRLQNRLPQAQPDLAEALIRVVETLLQVRTTGVAM